MFSKGLLLGLALAASTLGAAPAGLPADGGPVADLCHSLRPQTIEAMNDALYRARNIGQFQIVALVLPSLGQQAPQAIAQTSFHTWAILKSLPDRGIALILVPASGQAWIECGSGISSSLDEKTLQAILDKHVLPRLRDRDPDSAVIDGCSALAAELDVDLGVAPSSRFKRTSAYWFRKFYPYVVGIGVILMLAAMMVLVSYRQEPTVPGFRHPDSGKVFSRGKFIFFTSRKRRPDSR
jgi:uncharacterized membrane protein YgcG